MLLQMKRTTIMLDDDLMRRAKQSAAKRGITLTALIDEAVRERLARKPTPADKDDWVLPTFGDPNGKVAPGFDITDGASVQEFLDRGLPIEKLR
jgi:hypothetical protein